MWWRPSRYPYRMHANIYTYISRKPARKSRMTQTPQALQRLHEGACDMALVIGALYCAPTFNVQQVKRCFSNVWELFFLAQKNKWISKRLYFQVVLDITPAIYNSLNCTVTCSVAEFHGDLFSRHASPSEGWVFWHSTKEVKMLCPTRFVVETTENRTGGVAAEVCSSQTGLYEQNQRATYCCCCCSHINSSPQCSPWSQDRLQTLERKITLGGKQIKTEAR